MSGCYDCGRPYGDEHGFPDLVLEDAIWREISPTGDDGGLLCPSCICKRLHARGIRRAAGAFMSGPVRSISEGQMEILVAVRDVRQDVECLRLRMDQQAPAAPPSNERRQQP